MYYIQFQIILEWLNMPNQRTHQSEFKNNERKTNRFIQIQVLTIGLNAEIKVSSNPILVDDTTRYAFLTVRIEMENGCRMASIRIRQRRKGHLINSNRKMVVEIKFINRQMLEMEENPEENVRALEEHVSNQVKIEPSECDISSGGPKSSGLKQIKHLINK